MRLSLSYHISVMRMFPIMSHRWLMLVRLVRGAWLSVLLLLSFFYFLVCICSFRFAISHLPRCTFSPRLAFSSPLAGFVLLRFCRLYSVFTLILSVFSCVTYYLLHTVFNRLLSSPYAIHFFTFILF